MNEPQIGRRGASRTDCNLVVQIKDGSSDWRMAQLRDISATGFRVTRVNGLPSGNSVWLRLGAMAPVAAKVRWTGDGALGCAFLFPLDERAMAEVLDTLSAARGAGRRSGGSRSATPSTLAASTAREFPWHSR